MSKIQPTKTIAVLAINPASVSALIERVNAIVLAMATNKATFPTPTPPLATVQSSIDALIAAQSALKARTGTSADRDDRRNKLVTNVGMLHAYIQQVVNADPSQAGVIAAQAAMSLKKKPSQLKAPLAVKTTVSGSVKVVAKATKGARSNQWQYSTDGGKTWIDAPATTKASTEIHNLTPGSTVSYRQRALTKGGLGDWSQPISAIVA